MSQSSDNPVESFAETSKLMIDKTIVINALQKLIDEYPSPMIPCKVVRQALIKVVGAVDFSDLSSHPSLQKLDQIIAKAKSGVFNENN